MLSTFSDDNFSSSSSSSVLFVLFLSDSSVRDSLQRANGQRTRLSNSLVLFRYCFLVDLLAFSPLLSPPKDGSPGQTGRSIKTKGASKENRRCC